MAAEEVRGRHPDVLVLWQPKAWADAATCNKWVIEVAAQSILTTDVKPGERHLVLCDNLSGQTQKGNPQFGKLLDEMCKADVWNLLSGNTDEIQVVDHGFGASLKREAEEVQTEWLKQPENYKEWIGGRMSASRRRVMSTIWYGEAYARVCKKFNFCKVFDKLGSNLTLDGSRDNLIKLEGLETFSFNAEDINRDPKTGLFPAVEAEDAAEAEDSEPSAVEEPPLVANDDSDIEQDVEELEVQSGPESDCSDDGGTTDEDALEGEDYVVPAGRAIEPEVPDGRPRSIFKRRIAHRYDVGWYEGFVRRQITMSDRQNDNGKYEVRFDGETSTHNLALLIEDYGCDKHWVLFTQ